jgi:hypothetical protein
MQCVAAMSLLLMLTLLAATNVPVVTTKSDSLELGNASNGEYVDLSYLLEHIKMYEGFDVTTNGTVRFYASIYMFEDFWLQAQNDAKIPVVTRLAGLPDPADGAFVEVSGKIEYSNLEGGFYFLNATSWRTISLSPTPSSPATQPQPSATPQPTSQPTTEPATPPADGQPTPQQPHSGLTMPVEHGLILLAVIAVIAAVSTYVVHKRRKQPKNLRAQRASTIP